MKSFKRQPIPAISVLLVIAFLATSAIGYFVALASSRSGIAENELPLTSDNIYSEIQRDLLRPVLISSTMATDTFLRDWVLDGETDSADVVKYLNAIRTGYGAFSSFFVSEQTRNYYYADGILKQVSPHEERDAWYFRLRGMTDDYEINVDPDMANRDEMTIFINYKVYDYDGNYIGATGVGLTVHAVLSIIETYHEKYNREIYLTNEVGDVKFASSGVPAEVVNIFAVESSDVFTGILRPGVEESLSFERDGDTILANVRFIPELDWYLIVEQRLGAPAGIIISTFLLNLGISLAITIVVIVLVGMSIKAHTRNVNTLRGIVPICSYCKQIRDDEGYWSQVEAYVSEHSEAQFSHGICPDCMTKHFPDQGPAG